MGPMLGFKRFFNARRVVAGVELVQKIVKGQFDVPASFGTDPGLTLHTGDAEAIAETVANIRLGLWIYEPDRKI